MEADDDANLPALGGSRAANTAIIAGEAPADRREQRSRPRWPLFALIGSVFAIGAVGNALTPALAAHHPLALLVVEARNRNLLLASRVSITPFVVVATLRRVCTVPLFFVAGRRHGEVALGWLRRRGGAQLSRRLEGAFERAGPVLLVVFPNPIVCALAGAKGVRARTAAILVLVRSLVVVICVRLLAQAMTGPLTATVGFFGRYSLATTVATTGVAVACGLRERWRPTLSPRVVEPLETFGEPLEALVDAT